MLIVWPFEFSELCRPTVQRYLWGFLVLQRISHFETCKLPFSVVPQFLAFWRITNHCFYGRITVYSLLHPPSRQTKWYMLRFTVNKSLPQNQQILFQMVYQLFLEEVVPMRQLQLCCNTSQWCRRSKKFPSLQVIQIKLSHVSDIFVAPLVHKV